jgi:hypothetical protein
MIPVTTRSLFSMALAAAAVACTPVFPDDGVSPSPHPPTKWQTAIRFNLTGGGARYAGDSLRVEFWDGARRRVVTSSDMYDMGARVRTPWYRITTDGEMTTTLAVTVRHAAGATTTAAYPMTVRRDGFYSVGVMIATSYQMDWARGFTSGPHSFPLNPAAGAPAEDSLWIYHVGRPRACINCPS